MKTKMEEFLAKGFYASPLNFIAMFMGGFATINLGFGLFFGTHAWNSTAILFALNALFCFLNWVIVRHSISNSEKQEK